MLSKKYENVSLKGFIKIYTTTISYLKFWHSDILNTCTSGT